MSERGFTLIEIVVVLAVIALLAAVLTPMVVKYVRDARIARAAADTKAIAIAIAKLESDVHHYPYFSNGSGNLRDDQANVSVLVGPGDRPTDLGGTVKWLDNSAAACKPSGGTLVEATLNNHLITNGALWNTTYTQDRPYTWKGPYLGELKPDPWGNAYLVNIINARPAGSGCTKAAFALSAGPDGQIDTSFEAFVKTASAVAPVDDDIIYRID